jgi:hypothetical protein
MKGASAELCAKTIKAPNSNIVKMIGKSQNFFRSRKKAHNSINKDISLILLLKLEYGTPWD